MSIFIKEKIVNSCPNAIKWLYLHCNFQNFPGEHAPGPPREVLPSAVALSDPGKNPTFSKKISMEAQVYQFNPSTAMCILFSVSIFFFISTHFRTFSDPQSLCN